ncbi:hypothetical protein TRIUR3_23890 [Triticum urartu]|uniref:Uncharacterized protein n=1 Tax=Triticum urartu TaxID=4572 RepID=M7Z2A1_TRIUA|nr:hypothetical protein TRIUR3_23890 [Triticum urartu]
MSKSKMLAHELSHSPIRSNWRTSAGKRPRRRWTRRQSTRDALRSYARDRDLLHRGLLATFCWDEKFNWNRLILMSESETATATTSSREQDWSSLPADILVEILEYLRWSSHPSFGLVCRRWQSARALSPFYPVWITPLLLNVADVGSSNVRYYSPFYHKNFEIAYKLNTPGAKICCATGQHLTLCMKHLVLTVQLLTGDVCKLPPIIRGRFDAVVYDGDRRMFGVEKSFGVLRIARCIKNNMSEWAEWEYRWFDPDGPLFPTSPDCNPVLHNGLMYLLGEDGGLAVYDVSRHDGNFKILDKPNSFGFECEDSYLVESDQHELMVVLIGHRGTPVNIVKLNEHTMEWEKIENLERRSLFTGTLSTTMKETSIKWMQNKIFLPRFYDWPQTVLVDLVQQDDELAFVPNSRFSDTTIEDNYGTDIWTYELGQGEEAKEFWEMEKVNYSIWVDFSSY